MARHNKKLLIFLTIIFLPSCILGSPDWLKINGIAPCWPVVWLLPFSLNNNRWNSSIAAILLGIFLDSFTISDATYIPSLLFLTILWNRYGFHNKKIDSFFSVGLMSMLGTALVGISIWIQKIIFYSTLRNNWFHSWSIYVLISEILITGLVAPFFSSWLLISYKKN
tara:strand:+ start:140 stop:640 length:501 start_codon:yes stop_codon:yes gene_type:complete